MDIQQKLSIELGAIGCRHSFLTIERIAELQFELKKRYEGGQIDPTFYRLNLQRFQSGPQSMPEARSLIIIAAPLAITRLGFSYQGSVKNVIIPPYYVYDDKKKLVEKALGRSLGVEGFRIADAVVPYKLAAVRSGLAKYGRNNLAYVDGMGSFLRLSAFFTDYQVSFDNWFLSEQMEECIGCGICLGNCHTNCLDPDVESRFIARAQRCLTLYNEEPGGFPEWVKPWLHNSLIGCMRCQSPCPVNRPLMGKLTVNDSFGEEETNIILSTPNFENLPGEIMEKLKRYDLDQYYDLIPRNLKAVLDWKL